MVMKILGKDLFVNGFALNEDGRVIMGDGDVTEYFQGRPIDEFHDTSVGVTSGTVISYLVGQGMTADGKMLYIDLFGAPMPKNVTYSGGFPYTSDGALVVDSIGAIAVYNEGIPFSYAGAVAVGKGTPPPPMGTLIVTETGEFVVTENGTYLIS